MSTAVRNHVSQRPQIQQKKIWRRVSKSDSTGMFGRKPRITTHLFPIYVTTVKCYGVDEEDFFFLFGVKYDHTSSHASRKRFTRYCIRRLNSGYTKPRSKV